MDDYLNSKADKVTRSQRLCIAFGVFFFLWLIFEIVMANRYPDVFLNYHILFLIDARVFMVLMIILMGYGWIIFDVTRPMYRKIITVFAILLFFGIFLLSAPMPKIILENEAHTVYIVQNRGLMVPHDDIYLKENFWWSKRISGESVIFPVNYDINGDFLYINERETNILRRMIYLIE